MDESANQNKSQDITSRDTQGVQVDAENVEKSSSQNLTPENTRRNTTRAQPSVNAENVFDSPSSSRIQRYTSTGGIRNTPRRKVNVEIGMKNLVGGGNKKIKDVEGIGQFNSKYKAHDKTKLQK